LWTREPEALAAADRMLAAILGVERLEGERRIYLREEPKVSWSEGLAKSVLEVLYRGFDLAGEARIVIDPAIPGEPRAHVFRPGEAPSIAPHRVPSKLRPEDRERLRLAACRALEESDVALRSVQAFPESDRPRHVLVVGAAFVPAPHESIRLKIDADTGRFLAYRHDGWFCRGKADPALLEGTERLLGAVEASPFFLAGARRADTWDATDVRHHVEALWKRFEGGEEVENDFVYASVNRLTGCVAELTVNRSDLEPELGLGPEDADRALERAFAKHFPSARRCGFVRRMFVELPGRARKPRAWVANGVNAVGPVQIAVGDSGDVLRVDSV
jgi:hypothetical protein